MMKDLVEFAKKSMEEMQVKINYYKEKSDSIEKLEKELSEVKIFIGGHEYIHMNGFTSYIYTYLL